MDPADKSGSLKRDHKILKSPFPASSRPLAPDRTRSPIERQHRGTDVDLDRSQLGDGLRGSVPLHLRRQEGLDEEHRGREVSGLLVGSAGQRTREPLSGEG